jgi:hypothetical protein
MFIQNL